MSRIDCIRARIKLAKVFKIYDPQVRAIRKKRRGSIRAETREVNQGDLLNRDPYQFCWLSWISSLSFNLFLISAKDCLMIPEWLI